MSEVELIKTKPHQKANIMLENQNENKNKENQLLASKKNSFSIFKTRDYNDLIKNPDCTYIQEDKSKSFYYFCLCSEKDYFPICEACAFSCHKNHNPQIKIEGFFTCDCGLKNHKISEKSEKRFLQKSRKARKCFYSEFYAISYNKGFYRVPSGKSLCSVCFFSAECNCEIFSTEKPEAYANPSFLGECECDKHEEISVVTLSNELDKNADLNKHMLNFNFNIMTICPTPQRIFIDFLKEKIKDLVEFEERRAHKDFFKRNNNKNNKNNKWKLAFGSAEADSSYVFSENPKLDPYIAFNTDFVVYTLFEILKTFKADFSTQYLHIKNVFYPDISPFDLIGVLKHTVNFKRLLDYNENLELYFKTKANFAFMIYHVYIKSHFLGNNNLLNLKSMLNLNIVQRILYIHESKKFYKFALYSENLSKAAKNKNLKNSKAFKKSESKNKIKNKNSKASKVSELPEDPLDIPLFEFDQKLENWEQFIFEFANELINIIDTMLQVHDNQPIIKDVMCDVMLTLSKIMKFLIKYNLIDDGLKANYFETLQDVLVAFVNQLDETQQEYCGFVAKISLDVEEPSFADFLHSEKISFLEKSGKKEQSKLLHHFHLENENLKNNIWFVLPAIKSIFYYMLKKNDDLVIMKLKGKYSKTQSQEKYCFMSNNESDMLSKIFLLCVKIFSENSFSNLNKESVYKKKILKFDLYVKKILELLNGNSEFYLKSLESIIHQFKKKLDAIFIQDLGEEKNNPRAYKEFLKSKIFAENNFSNKHYNNLNMKVLTSEKDFHLEIVKGLNLELFVEFNEINIDFGSTNKNFYEYDIDFKEFADFANKVWDRFRDFFRKLEVHPEKIKADLLKQNKKLVNSDKNVVKKIWNMKELENENENQNNDFNFEKIDEGQFNNLDNKNKNDNELLNENNKDNNNNNINNNYNESKPKINTSMNNGMQVLDTHNNLHSGRQNNKNKAQLNNKKNNNNYNDNEQIENQPSLNFFKKFIPLKNKSLNSGSSSTKKTKSTSFQQLSDLKHLIGYTDFMENFNEFLDIYARSKSFDSKLNAINIRYDLLKFILNMLYIISDDSNDNLVLIMTINPIKLVDAFFEYKEELCILLCRLANVVSKFDYNDNYFFLTDFINRMIFKLKIDSETGMSQEDFAVFTMILKAFKKLLPKYNLYNNELINTYEIINNKIIELKNNKKMMLEINDFVNGLFLFNCVKECDKDDKNLVEVGKNENKNCDDLENLEKKNFEIFHNDYKNDNDKNCNYDIDQNNKNNYNNNNEDGLNVKNHYNNNDVLVTSFDLNGNKNNNNNDNNSNNNNNNNNNDISNNFSSENNDSELSINKNNASNIKNIINNLLNNSEPNNNNNDNNNYNNNNNNENFEYSAHNSSSNLIFKQQESDKIILRENLIKPSAAAFDNINGINNNNRFFNNLKKTISAKIGKLEIQEKNKNKKQAAYIFDSFFKNYFALLNIAFDKDLYYYDLFYDKEILILDKSKLKEIITNSHSLKIPFREEVERFLHNYNLKSKIKFSTVEREFSRYQRKNNLEKGNLKYIFSGKFIETLNFSCDILEMQMKSFLKNCNLTHLVNNTNNVGSNYINDDKINNINNEAYFASKASNKNDVKNNNKKASKKKLNSKKDVAVQAQQLKNGITNSNNKNSNANINNDNNDKKINSININNINTININNIKFNNTNNKSTINKKNAEGVKSVKINSIFSYLENAIISPLYKVINMFMLDKEKLKGEEYFTVYKLVFYLHQVLNTLYNLSFQINKKNKIRIENSNRQNNFFRNFFRSGSKSNSKNKKKDLEYLPLSKYFYGDIKQKLSETNLDYLSKNLNKLKELRYFQFEEIVNIFRVTLALIKKNNTFNFIHLRKKFNRFNIIENSYLDCNEENSKDKIFVDYYNKIVQEAAVYFLDDREEIFYAVIEEYKKILGETFGNKFSLIKVLESTDLDCEVNLTGVLLSYIINKFADKLTRANQHLFVPQNIFTFDEAYKVEIGFVCEKNKKKNDNKVGKKENFVFDENLNVKNNNNNNKEKDFKFEIDDILIEDDFLLKEKKVRKRNYVIKINDDSSNNDFNYFNNNIKQEEDKEFLIEKENFILDTERDPVFKQEANEEEKDYDKNKKLKIKDFRNFVEGKNLKMQNFYVLFFLRNLFFFDPEKFQKALLDFFTTKKTNFEKDFDDEEKIQIKKKKFNFNNKNIIENENSFSNNEIIKTDFNYNNFVPEKDVYLNKIDSIKFDFRKFQSLNNINDNKKNNKNNLDLNFNKEKIDKNFLRKMTYVPNSKSKKITQKSIPRIRINNNISKNNHNNLNHRYYQTNKQTSIQNLHHFSNQNLNHNINENNLNKNNYNNFNSNNSFNKNNNLIFHSKNSKQIKSIENFHLDTLSETSDSQSSVEDSIYIHLPEETFVLDKEKIHYFFSIINKYFIFGNFLCEAGKLFELCNERTLIRSNFIYDLLVTNIFLMQNICEGHNPVTQELMFDMRLKPTVEETRNLNVDLSEELLELHTQRDTVATGQKPQINVKTKFSNNLIILDKEEKNFENLEIENLNKIKNINNYDKNDNEQNKKQKKKKKKIMDKERQKIEKFLAERNDFEFSYINFLSNLMRNIVCSLYFDFDNRYVFINKTFSLNSNFICVYSKLTDLFIEMIQGTQEHNLYNFFVPEREKENEIIPCAENINQIKDFQFIIFLQDIKQVFSKDWDDPEKELSIIKTLTFSILNNILNQENVNHDLIWMLMKIFEVDFLIGKMSKYMKKLVVRFQLGILYEHPQFSQIVKKINLTNFSIEDFYKIFLTNQELPDDNYFLLCVQIFYFINITGDKFLMQESVDLLELDAKKCDCSEKPINKANTRAEDFDESTAINHIVLEVANTLFLKSNKLENKIKIFFENSLSKNNRNNERNNYNNNKNNNLVDKQFEQKNGFANIADFVNNYNEQNLGNNFVDNKLGYHKIRSSIASGASHRPLVKQSFKANGNENVPYSGNINEHNNKNDDNINLNGNEILNLQENNYSKNDKNNKNKNNQINSNLKHKKLTNKNENFTTKKTYDNFLLSTKQLTKTIYNFKITEPSEAHSTFPSPHELIKDSKPKITPLEDILYTKQFYAKIVNSVEFVIEDEGGSRVKEIYFIKNPTGYLINETNIKNFFKNADRKDPTTKITALLDSLENFLLEIDYQLRMENRLRRYLLQYDYKITDFFSFVFSLIVNLILLFSLTDEIVDSVSLRKPIFEAVRGLGIAQIFVNLLSLLMFLIVKQKLWISYELNKIRKTEFSYMGKSIVEDEIILAKISLFKKMKVFIIDCFLLNEEVILINFNLVLGVIGISQFHATMVFSMQLLTVVRFVETIRDILQAFRSRFDQLIAMVFFLLFLIYFYTNVAFFFLNGEFQARELGHTVTHEQENTCSSLIRCFIYHFNEGVRSGGGIGDNLDIKSWENLPLFFGRWMLDMIFFISVLLLLLNMINGIIVSTFSAIREESEQKADDEVNRCFICSIDKAEFENRKLSFDTHIKKEHNVKSYINFIIFLKMTPNKNLDSNQGFIKECIENRDLNVFPIYQSKALGPGIFDKKDED